MTKKIGLVGAGYICEYHAKAIAVNPALELVGVTDIDQDKAKSIANQFNCKAYISLAEMVKNGAEAIHVLTPPNTHTQVASEAMELGCDVLVEKPLAEDPKDCESLHDLSIRLGKKVCVNHSLLFDPQIIKAKNSIEAGKIGTVVSVDILRSSVYPTYPGGTLPPHYRDGGYPFRDLGIHCLYLIEHFLGEIKDIDAKWQSLGGDKNLVFDEWSATTECENGIGRFQLSWNVKPLQNLIIIQGTKGILRVDSFLMFNSMRKSLPAPKVVERIANNYTDSLRPIFEMPINIIKFATGKIVPYQGLTNLINEFYSALEDHNKTVPVSIKQAIPSVHWVEKIARRADKEAIKLHEQSFNLASADVLVTGGTGGLGSNIVNHLIDAGYSVRVLARSIPKTPDENVQYVTGSLGNPEVVDEAAKNVRFVVHAGAAMQGDENEHICSTELGTKNIIAAIEMHRIKKLIHISSLSVVDWAGNDNCTVDESSNYEPNPKARGYYTQYKLKAEKLIIDACSESKINAIILRPGQIFGGKLPLLTGAVARKVGSKMLVFGDGEIKLPLIYIDDVSDAVVAALQANIANGEILHLTDTVVYTQNQILEKVAPNQKVIRIPRKVMFTMGGMSEKAFKLLKRQSPFARYRLESAMPRISFASEKASSLLNWKPKTGVDKGMEINSKDK